MASIIENALALVMLPTGKSTCRGKRSADPYKHRYDWEYTLHLAEPLVCNCGRMTIRQEVGGGEPEPQDGAGVVTPPPPNKGDG